MPKNKNNRKNRSRKPSKNQTKTFYGVVKYRDIISDEFNIFPVKNIFDKDDNQRKLKFFRPKHVDDFEKTRYYFCRCSNYYNKESCKVQHNHDEALMVNIKHLAKTEKTAKLKLATTLQKRIIRPNMVYNDQSSEYDGTIPEFDERSTDEAKQLSKKKASSSNYQKLLEMVGKKNNSSNKVVFVQIDQNNTDADTGAKDDNDAQEETSGADGLSANKNKSPIHEIVNKNTPTNTPITNENGSNTMGLEGSVINLLEDGGDNEEGENNVTLVEADISNNNSGENDVTSRETNPVSRLNNHDEMQEDLILNPRLDSDPAVPPVDSSLIPPSPEHNHRAGRTPRRESDNNSRRTVLNPRRILFPRRNERVKKTPYTRKNLVQEALDEEIPEANPIKKYVPINGVVHYGEGKSCSQRVWESTVTVQNCSTLCKNLAVIFFTPRKLINSSLNLKKTTITLSDRSPRKELSKNEKKSFIRAYNGVLKHIFPDIWHKNKMEVLQKAMYHLSKKINDMNK